ncbi:hypothetical protein FQN50_009279 [Emmonsiellopsis sp. PD_5]|nr:hypothetical protein FQN50_009279 [Emmonsiellopsis sp. PD_5]
MPNLLTLPPELLLHILAYLEIPALLSTLRTCHALHSLYNLNEHPTGLVTSHLPESTTYSNAGTLLLSLYSAITPTPLISLGTVENLLRTAWLHFLRLSIEEALFPIAMRLARAYAAAGQLDRAIKLLEEIHNAQGPFTRSQAPAIAGGVRMIGTYWVAKGRWGWCSLVPLERLLVELYEARATDADADADADGAISSIRAEATEYEERYSDASCLLIGESQVAWYKGLQPVGNEEFLRHGICFNESRGKGSSNAAIVAIVKMERAQMKYFETGGSCVGLVGRKYLPGVVFERLADRRKLYTDDDVVYTDDGISQVLRVYSGRLDYEESEESESQ